MKANQWTTSYNGINLRNDCAYLFKISLEGILNDSLEQKMSIDYLNHEEKTKFHRYKFNKDKNRFAIARLAIKMILADYLVCKLENINLEIDDFGKPFLSNHADIQFNISHSGEFIGLAISKHAIGIDIEVYNDKINYRELAQTVFSDQELTQIKNIDRIKLAEAFYRCWAKKEAYMKAIGKGFHVPLKQFSVRIFDEGENNLLEVEWDEKEINKWKCFNFEFHERYGAASCLNKEITDYRFIDFTPTLIHKHLNKDKAYQSIDT